MSASIASRSIPLLAVLAVWTLHREARRPARELNGQRIVCYPLALQALLLLSTLGLCWSFREVSASLFESVRTDTPDAILAFTIILMVALAIAGTWHVLMWQVRFDAGSIHYRSPWRASVSASLDEVRSVIGGITGWTITFSNGRKVRFNAMQRGWRQLRDALRHERAG